MSNEDSAALRAVAIWLGVWIVGAIVGYVVLWTATIALGVGDYGWTVYWIGVAALLATTCALGLWLAHLYLKGER